MSSTVRRSLVAALLALSFLSFPTSAFADRAIGLSTPKFKFSLPPGGTGRGRIEVSNEGTEDLQYVLVYSADVVMDKKGNSLYKVPGRNAPFMSSPALWMTVKVADPTKIYRNTSFISLRRDQRQPVSFSIQAPFDAAPGDYTAILFFEMLPPQPGKAASRSLIGGRLGARVSLRVLGQIRRQTELRPFSVPYYVIGNSIPYSMTVRNTGNVDQPFTIRLDVIDRSEAIVKAALIERAGYIYAKRSRDYGGNLSVSSLPIGSYVMRLRTVLQPTIHGEATRTITKTRRFWIIPGWTYNLGVGLGVVLILAFGYVAQRVVRGIGTRLRASAARRRQAPSPSPETVSPPSVPKPRRRFLRRARPSAEDAPSEAPTITEAEPAPEFEPEPALPVEPEPIPEPEPVPEPEPEPAPPSPKRPPPRRPVTQSRGAAATTRPSSEGLSTSERVAQIRAARGLDSARKKKVGEDEGGQAEPDDEN